MNNASLPPQHTKSQQLYWILQAAGWGFYTVSRIIGAATIIKLPWGKSALELAIFGGVGLAISHGLRDFVRRHNWAAFSIPKLATRIVVASFIVGTPLGIVTQMTDVSALQDPSPELQEYAPALGASMTVTIQTLLQIANWAMVYVIWLTIYFAAVGVREYRTARLKQSELARALQLAELRLLKSQLNPHFLFNALNTVRSLVADSPSRAQSAVTRLANTLRYTLSSRQDELVTFAQELAIVTDYLELESMRFEGRLRVETDVAADAASVYIPVMLLQTLVENAIKHGIAELPSGGLVRISAVLENAMLTVEIENPRPPAPIPATGEGVGLRNARDRLRLLFGTRAALDLDLSNPAVATARLRVPHQR
jgi:two-component system, LytTR family, sensor histidine kinase AlgZ